MKKETLKQKQSRFNKLFKDIMKQLKENGATFIATPDPTTKNIRVIMVEQQEADAYFTEVFGDFFNGGGKYSGRGG